MRKCEVSGKYINGKPVVLCEYAYQYVEKQGFKIIPNHEYYMMKGEHNVN